MKKILTFTAVAVFLFVAKPAEAKNFVTLLAGFSDRIYVNNIYNDKKVHHLGGHFELGYAGFSKPIGKKAEVALDLFLTYIGVSGTIKIDGYPFSITNSFHNVSTGLGPIFTFMLSKKLDLFLRADIGAGFDFASSNSEYGASGIGRNLLWKVALGLNININEKIGIPIEVGYLGTYTIANPESMLMHGVQVSTGIRFYL